MPIVAESRPLGSAAADLGSGST